MGWMPIPFLRGAAMTVGASAAIFGLLGSLVYYGRRGGSSLIRTEALGYAVTLGIMGFILPGVDNYAHGGGFSAATWRECGSTRSSQSAWITSSSPRFALF